eukprot:UC4_evm2s1386
MASATAAAAESAARLRRLQRVMLLHSSSPSALLLVLGIDGSPPFGSLSSSSSSDAAAAALNFIFFGTNACDASLHRTHAGIGEELFENVLVLITPCCVHIYCEPQAREALLPRLRFCRNVCFYCMQPKDWACAQDGGDIDTIHNFKIRSFCDMVRPYHKIGIPLEGPADVVEEWPIFKTFASEEQGTGGKFTKLHNVVDAMPILRSVYSCIDVSAFKAILKVPLVSLSKHWSTFILNLNSIGRKANSTKDACDALRAAARPLETYSRYGKTKNHNSSGFLERLSGKRFRYMINGDIDTRGATHVTCETLDPRGPLWLARTYILGDHLDFRYRTSQSDTQGLIRDMRLAHNINRAMVDVLEKIVERLCRSNDDKRADHTTAVCSWARGYLKSILNDEIFEDILVDHPTLLDEGFEFDLMELDAFGVIHENTHKQCISSGRTKALRIAIAKVPSLQYPNKNIGDIVVGDTFMNVDINTSSSQQDEPAMYRPNVFLTQGIPRYFNLYITDASAIPKKISQKSCQSILVDFLPAFVIVDPVGSSCYLEPINIRMSQRSVTLSSERVGRRNLVSEKGNANPSDYQWIDSTYYIGDGPAKYAVLIANAKALPNSLAYMRTTERYGTRICVFMPKGTAVHRAFLNEVLPYWKRKCHEPGHVDLQTSQSIPEFLLPIAQSLELSIDKCLKVSPKLEKVFCENSFNDFISILGLRDCYDVSTLIPGSEISTDLLKILKQFKIEGTEQILSDKLPKVEVTVNIITGMPGTGKQRVVDSVVALVQEESNWVVIEQELDDWGTFSPQKVQSRLETALAHQNISAEMGLKTRVLLVTSGCAVEISTIVRNVVQCVVSYGKRVKIGSINCCVDLQNTFMNDCKTFPKLLEQCAPGFANNIILSGRDHNSVTADMPQKSTQRNIATVALELIKTLNPWAKLIRTIDGRVTNTNDLETILSDSAFSDADQAKFRCFSYPGYSVGEEHPAYIPPGKPYCKVEHISLKFFKPLDSKKFKSCLRKLLEQPAIASDRGTIYRIKGRVRLCDMDNALFNVDGVKKSSHFCVTRSNRDIGQDGCMIFVGIGLIEEDLKNVLRQCRPKQAEPKALRKPDSLTPKEKKMIQEKHKLDPLPPGYYFNGYKYVSMDGEMLFVHPNTADFVEGYLKEINKKIIAENESIIKVQPDTIDMFECTSDVKAKKFVASPPKRKSQAAKQPSRTGKPERVRGFGSSAPARIKRKLPKAPTK